MEVFCDLEVDVNGEETFMVNKRILTSYSGRFNKLFGKSKCSTTSLKVVFHDFPGGAECFENVLRFCYNSGRTKITPFNIFLLHCAADFMELKNSVSGNHNLWEQTEKSFKEISYWTWLELLGALKQFQSLHPASASFGVTDRCLDSLIGRLPLASEASPCPSTSSPDGTGFRFSCDTKSTESFRTIFSRTTWWFKDLLVLDPILIKRLVKSMLSRNFDHVLISRFLFYYQKSKFHDASSDDKRRLVETVIEMLYILDQSCLSCKSLFGILRVVLNLKINKCSRNKLENMIGMQLDQATLDNLLVPSPHGMNHLYDVNLVFRFLSAFLLGDLCEASSMRLSKVATLIDLYIAEVAPDPYLKASKFVALAKALPDCARESYDYLYHAIDMYLEVHRGLSEEEKMKICNTLNYGKLSDEVCIDLSYNSKFPLKSSVQALSSQQFKLRSLLYGTNNSKLHDDNLHSKPVKVENKVKKDESSERLVLYAEKLDNGNIKEHLKGMQRRAMELEKACRKMQIQMANITKSRVPNNSNARSLPKLCS